MITQEQIKIIIEKAESQKQELQELINSLTLIESEQKDKVSFDEEYWYVDNISTTIRAIQKDNQWDEMRYRDEMRYNAGNYFTTKSEGIKDEKEVRLRRLLKRFSKQNGWRDSDWGNDQIFKYFIFFDCYTKKFEIGCRQSTKSINEVYFTSEEVAKQALEKYYDLISEIHNL